MSHHGQDTLMFFSMMNCYLESFTTQTTATIAILVFVAVEASILMYRSFCMASKNNFPHAYLVEQFRCTFYSVVQYFSLAYLVIALGL